MSGPNPSLFSFAAPAYSRARTLGSKVRFVTQLEATLPVAVKRFEDAHAFELLAKSPQATKARELAQQDLVKAVRKKAPDQLAMLEASLKEVLGESAAIGRVGLKYKVKPTATHAKECVTQVFRDLPGGATDVARLGNQTLTRVHATVGAGFDKWIDLGLLLGSNLKKIAEHAKLLRERLEKLQKLEPGTPEYEAVLGEIAIKGGTRWSIRGMLFELYVASSLRWRRRLDLHLLRATAIAKTLGPEWEVVTQHGDMHLAGKNDGFKLGWDMAILIVNRKTKVVKVHTTVQVKAENDVSALTQIIKDYQRERLGGELHLQIGGEPLVLTIENLPGGHHTNRYVFFAAGGKLSNADIARLEKAGLRAAVIEADLHLKELDAATFQIMFTMEKLYNQLVATGKF